MDDSIENVNLSSPEIKTKKFNKKSLFLILNYFVTPILISVVLFLALNNQTIFENLMNLPSVSKFFQDNPYLLKDEEAFKNFIISVVSSIAILITFIIGVFLSRNRSDSISIRKSERTLIKLLLF